MCVHLERVHYQRQGLVKARHHAGELRGVCVVHVCCACVCVLCVVREGLCVAGEGGVVCVCVCVCV